MVTSGSTSSGIELSNFRKYFFRKLPSSILEEVVPEDTSRSTSSGIELSNFRKSNILIPELLPPVVKISFGNSFLLFIFSKNYPENAKNTDKLMRTSDEIGRVTTNTTSNMEQLLHGTTKSSNMEQLLQGTTKSSKLFTEGEQ